MTFPRCADCDEPVDPHFDLVEGDEIYLCDPCYDLRVEEHTTTTTEKECNP